MVGGDARRHLGLDGEPSRGVDRESVSRALALERLQVQRSALSGCREALHNVRLDTKEILNLLNGRFILLLILKSMY